MGCSYATVVIVAHASPNRSERLPTSATRSQPLFDSISREPHAVSVFTWRILREVGFSSSFASMEGAVSEAFERIVQKCLAKQPEERFASARQLARALDSLELEPWTEVEASAWWAENPVEQAPPSVTVPRQLRPARP